MPNAKTKPVSPRPVASPVASGRISGTARAADGSTATRSTSADGQTSATAAAQTVVITHPKSKTGQVQITTYTDRGSSTPYLRFEVYTAATGDSLKLTASSGASELTAAFTGLKEHPAAAAASLTGKLNGKPVNATSTIDLTKSPGQWGPIPGWPVGAFAAQFAKAASFEPQTLAGVSDRASGAAPAPKAGTGRLAPLGRVKPMTAGDVSRGSGAPGLEPGTVKVTLGGLIAFAGVEGAAAWRGFEAGGSAGAAVGGEAGAIAGSVVGPEGTAAGALVGAAEGAEIGSVAGAFAAAVKALPEALTIGSLTVPAEMAVDEGVDAAMGQNTATDGGHLSDPDGGEAGRAMDGDGEDLNSSFVGEPTVSTSPDDVAGVGGAVGGDAGAGGGGGGGGGGGPGGGGGDREMKDE